MLYAHFYDKVFARQILMVLILCWISIHSATAQSKWIVRVPDDDVIEDTIGESEEEQKDLVLEASDANESRLKFAFELGYGFLDNEGSGGSAYTYEVTLGTHYMITKSLYAGARIGYNSANYIASFGESESHLLEIPIETGYAFASRNDYFAFVPFLGFNFNIGLTGKSKIKGGDSIKQKIGGKLGADFKVGIRFRLWGFNLGGAYHIPINKRQKEFFGENAYPEISIGFGF